MGSIVSSMSVETISPLRSLIYTYLILGITEKVASLFDSVEYCITVQE